MVHLGGTPEPHTYVPHLGCTPGWHAWATLSLTLLTPLATPEQLLSLGRGVQPFGVSGHTGRRVVLGHTLNTQTLTKTNKQKKVLSEFTILCWSAVIATLGPWSPGVDTGIPFLGSLSRPRLCPSQPPSPSSLPIAYLVLS